MVYLTKYSSPQHSIFNRSEERIFREFVDYLSKIFPNFSEKDLEEYLSKHDKTYFVIEENGEILGGCGYYISNDIGSGTKNYCVFAHVSAETIG